MTCCTDAQMCSRLALPSLVVRLSCSAPVLQCPLSCCPLYRLRQEHRTGRRPLIEHGALPALSSSTAMHLPGAPPEIRRGPGRFHSPVFSAWIISSCCLQTLTMHLFRAAIRGISMFVVQAFRCRCQPAAAYADSCFPTCRQTASLTPQQMLPQLLCKAVYACPPVTGTERHALHSTGYSFTSIPRLSSSCLSCSLLSHNLSPR